MDLTLLSLSISFRVRVLSLSPHLSPPTPTPCLSVSALDGSLTTKTANDFCLQNQDEGQCSRFASDRYGLRDLSVLEQVLPQVLP